MRPSVIISALLLSASLSYAENIVLKSGDKIEATVVEERDEYVRINFKGADILYRVSEIETIDGKPVVPTKKSEPDKSLGFILKSEGVKNAPATPQKAGAADYLKRGFTYYSKDNLDQALIDLGRAIDANPGMIEAYLYRGLAYMKKGEPDKAITDYNKAIELGPNNEEAYYLRGTAYAARKDTDRALADYSKAISLNPKYVQAYLNRGIINLSRQDRERAIADMVRIMQINDRVPAAYYIRGVAYANENDMQRAISDYDEAIRLKPDYVEAYIDRALAYAYKDKVEQSKMGQNSPAAYINIGLDKISKENYDKALADCNKSIELAPKSINAYTARARIYIMGNDYDRAWADVHKIEELGGKFAPELLEGLKRSSGREK